MKGHSEMTKFSSERSVNIFLGTQKWGPDGFYATKLRKANQNVHLHIQKRFVIFLQEYICLSLSPMKFKHHIHVTVVTIGFEVAYELRTLLAWGSNLNIAEAQSLVPQANSQSPSAPEGYSLPSWFLGFSSFKLLSKMWKTLLLFERLL